MFVCEKCRSYLEHKEFELHCDNLSLCWLLEVAKVIGRIGRRVLRLDPFHFNVRHALGSDNAVTDALSRMFAGECSETPEITCVTLLPTLPLVYTSIEEHHLPDSFCNEPRQKILNRQAAAEKFSIHKNLVCFYLQESQAA